MLLNHSIPEFIPKLLVQNFFKDMRSVSPSRRISKISISPFLLTKKLIIKEFINKIYDISEFVIFF